jgi:hypothetical protein
VSNEQTFKALQKMAAATTAELERVTRVASQLTKQASELQSIVNVQQRKLEAYVYATKLAADGSIDAEQIEDEVERIEQLGLSQYKVAAFGSVAQEHSFGDTVAEKSPDEVETNKVAHTLDGKPLSTMEAWLLRWREMTKGVPANIV